MFNAEALGILIGAAVLIAGGAGKVDVDFVGVFLCPLGEDVEGFGALGDLNGFGPPFGEGDACCPAGAGGFVLFRGVAGELQGAVEAGLAVADEGGGIGDEAALGGLGERGEGEGDALARGGEGTRDVDVDVVAAAGAEGVAAVADGGESLAGFDALAGTDDKGAGAEVGVVGELAVVVLDGDEVAEAAAEGVLAFAAVPGVDDAAAHGNDTTAGAEADGSDVPGVETAAPVGGATVGALGDDPVFAGGGGQAVALVDGDEQARGGTLDAARVFDHEPVFAGGEAAGVAGEQVSAADLERGERGDELPGVGGAVGGEMNDAFAGHAGALERDVRFAGGIFVAGDAADEEAAGHGGVGAERELALVEDGAAEDDADRPFAGARGLFKTGEGHLRNEAHEGGGGESVVVDEVHDLGAGGEPFDGEPGLIGGAREKETEENAALGIVDGGDGFADRAAVFAGGEGESAFGYLLRLERGGGEEQEEG